MFALLTSLLVDLFQPDGASSQELGQLDRNERVNDLKQNVHICVDECQFLRTLNEQKLTRFQNYVGTKGGNPDEKGDKKTAKKKPVGNNLRKNDADSSSNTSSPNKNEFETTFETTALIHIPSPRKDRSRQTKPLDEAFSSSDNDDEIVVTNTSESLSDGDDIDIVKDIVDIQSIGRKLEAKKQFKVRSLFAHSQVVPMHIRGNLNYKII